ncbi:MAG: hypothetical protein R3246_12720 [Acidimicrobiia bacterium]|nr:hypothetical protein [Acidimicrobiia bacterium]
MTREPVPSGIVVDRLRWVYAAAVTLLAVALIASGWATVRHRSPDGGLPDWMGMLVIAAVGIVFGFVVRYWRRRPILPGREEDYAATIALRIGTAAVPSLAGLGLYLATGTWWVHFAGSVMSLVWLLWAVPSDRDYERHQRLAVGPPPMPPQEAWGAADPDEPAPWDDEHGGHGHGLVDF